MNFKKLIFFYFIVSLLTLLVLTPDLVFFFKNKVYNYAISGFFIVQALLFIPVVLFSRRLKIYYWILAIIVSLTPIMLVPVFLINIQVNAEMVGLVMDTNFSETKELLGWKIILVAIASFFFGWLFIKLSKKLPSKIRYKHGLIISLIGIFSFGLLPFIRSRKLEHYPIIARNTFRTYYPFRLANAYSLLKSEMKNMERYAATTKNFSFGAHKINSKDSLRNIHVLIVGEASRYDHWAINGYARNTSPQIKLLKNFTTFSNVASGGTMTIMSVPQLITRADAATYDRHKNEKSILAAFKEAGYYTAWISNQSQYGLTGNIGMHFNDGDTAMYCGHGENEGNFTGSFDEGVIEKMKLVMDKNPSKDIFLVIHLIGSHWRYLLRYPPAFEVFKPVSDRNRSLMSRPPSDVMINEYDNSILYTDYVLKSIADLINQKNANASFLYVSDHGENLNDGNNDMYFHSFVPNRITATVPLFIWCNDNYAQHNPLVLQTINENKNTKISSAESVFYSVIDIAGLSITGNDSTKSVAKKYLQASKQIVLGENSKLYNYNDLK
jgi:glucan phosphoethanolaminetransferase (alkaline phosphatase superfamily)